MTDPYITLESEGGSLSSHEVSSHGVGVEVQPGVTGLGLPGVELQFDQSAGDGAKYRSRRVLQRPLDLKFVVYGPTRDDLKANLDRISLILAHPVTVTWVDEDADERWRIVGYRSGGGDYSYGEQPDEDGTDGYTYAAMSVTLTTETPYWEAAAPTVVPVTGAGSLALDVPGTAETAPIWRVKGPTYGFRAQSEDGESLWFSGLIDSDTTVTIDCANGTVVDDKGHNRYNDLTDLPRFWKLKPGRQNVAISYDRSSSDYQVIYGNPRHNFVRNPKFQTGSDFWSLTGWSYDSATRSLVQNGSTTSRPVISTVLSGLTVGQNYVLRFGGWISRSTPWPTGSTTLQSKVVILDGQVRKSKVYGPTEITGFGSVPFEFTAENTSVTLEFYPLCAERKDGKFARSEGTVDMFYVGEPGLYFDGDNADTAQMRFDWTGDPNASVSTATPITIPTSTGGGITNPFVTVEYRPRKWLVI